ncbi:3-keto-5-aminohexanoate cleavage protein [Candidatus Margulisiibacteriota bacterium]
MKKLIITLALTGNVPTKELNESTPITPLEIADELEECSQLGVSIAHIHARNKDQKPTHNRGIFKSILDEMKKRKTNIITQLSTGARGGENTLETRSQMLDLSIDMASLATGSSNFPDRVNANSPQLVEGLIEKMYAHNVKPEIEAFDMGMIDMAKRYLKKGILKAPLHFNMVMGVPGSIAGTPQNLMHMVQSLPPHSTWSVCGIGPVQVSMITLGIVLGGHVRTGLEDTMLYGKGIKATNKMLVERILRIAKELNREIATTNEAREILNL